MGFQLIGVIFYFILIFSIVDSSIYINKTIPKYWNVYGKKICYVREFKKRTLNESFITNLLLKLFLFGFFFYDNQNC